jgi:lipopolysaccharide transport system ATP-binding protein
MSIIQAKNLIVEFPVIGANGAGSLRKSAINFATGGFFAKDIKNRTVVRALDNLSFTFNEGDRIGIVGHNGSGKSTLLQVLAGVYEPISGEIKVDGQVTSMLSITLGMDAEVSGIENIYLRGRLMGLSKSEVDGMVDRIIDFSELGNFIDLPLRAYSSGMTMRLAFSIATSVDSDIILMDEWLSVGDIGFVKKAQDRLMHMMEKSRLVVLASHNHSLVSNICTKVIQLEHGKIISEQ